MMPPMVMGRRRITADTALRLAKFFGTTQTNETRFGRSASVDAPALPRSPRAVPGALVEGRFADTTALHEPDIP